jgi:SAM-dependent methyltransferase
MTMPNLNDQPNSISHEDDLVINLVVTAIHHPQYLTILNTQLTQAEEAGWTSLVKAIRGILGGERNLDNLGSLDKEDLHIVTAVFNKLNIPIHISGASTSTSTQPSPQLIEHDGNNYLKPVRSQYESYPYPKRNPLDERVKLFVTSTEHLGKIGHYCFNGTRDLREGGRFLIAGGGTGDAAIYLAEQLRDTDAEVVYVDLSVRSMDIARQRAEIRGLTNISWHHNSLLDLPNLNLGDFDYINCCGVLHHLSDPAKGLQALSSVLKDDGCMAIMVYAQYGRTAIYQIQELMRYINNDEQDFQRCISNTRHILANLPDSNWYKRDESRWRETLNEFGDIEIFDLFLHSQDRAYTVPEIYQLALENGLNLISFTGFTGQKLHYDFSKYIKDQGIFERINKMSAIRQQAIAELLNGCIKTHSFYLSKANNTLADINNLDLVPYYTFKFVPCETLYSDLVKTPNKPIAINFGSGVEPLVIPQFQYTRFIFRYINGEYSVREILARAHHDAKLSNLSPSENELAIEFKRIFNKFFSYDLMFMRHHAIKPYKCEYQLAEETLKQK